ADIARKYEVEIFDVLTGFKFIADIMQRQEGKREFIIGSEESYGYLAGDFVRDKDAVMSCALLAETAAWARARGKTLYELLLDIYLEFGLYLEELTYIVRKGKSGAELIAEMMQNYRETPPVKLAGSRVVLIHDYQSSKTQDILTGETSPIELPKSNVLQFITEDDTKVSIRPSGTEPKIKFYFSVKGSLENRQDYPAQKAILEQKFNTLKKELGISDK
ncbi:MAG: phospho-sugar mutase, partial [Bacteroidales bacterium]|nr:phospho-sugar mutase [Bacteroidales bacterium]